MIRPRRLAVLLVALWVLGGAACGGDDESSASTKDRPTTTTIVAKTTTTLDAAVTTTVPVTSTTAAPAPPTTVKAAPVATTMPRNTTGTTTVISNGQKKVIPVSIDGEPVLTNATASSLSRPGDCATNTMRIHVSLHVSHERPTTVAIGLRWAGGSVPEFVVQPTSPGGTLYTYNFAPLAPGAYEVTAAAADDLGRIATKVIPVQLACG